MNLGLRGFVSTARSQHERESAAREIVAILLDTPQADPDRPAAVQAGRGGEIAQLDEPISYRVAGSFSTSPIAAFDQTIGGQPRPRDGE